MSKRNNVNPDHYKVAGRARQGEDVLQEQERRTLSQPLPENEGWSPPKARARRKASSTRPSRRRRQSSS